MDAVSNTASIVQLVDFGVRVAVQVAETVQTGLDPPDIIGLYRQKRLPRLVEQLLLLQYSPHPPGTEKITEEVVQDCYLKLESLNKQLNVLMMKAGDSAFG